MGIRPITKGIVLQHMTTSVTKNPKVPTNSKSLVVDVVFEPLFWDELFPVAVASPDSELPPILPSVVEELAFSTGAKVPNVGLGPGLGSWSGTFEVATIWSPYGVGTPVCLTRLAVSTVTGPVPATTVT